MIELQGESIFNKSKFIEIIKNAKDKKFYFIGCQQGLKNETMIKRIEQQKNGGQLFYDTQKDIYIIGISKENKQ